MTTTEIVWTDPAWTVDPEFHRLCPPLSDEELRQLEANLLADGCRDPLVVWEEGGLLLDGHNRYAMCQEHALPFPVTRHSLPDRDAAIHWIIANQLGRRNLTPEQKSYLRGKRYQQEKKAISNEEGVNQYSVVDTDFRYQPQTRERVSKEQGVAPSTIQADDAFVTALDTLEAEVRADIRDIVLKRQERGKQQATKKQVTHVGKLIKDEQVARLPFMERQGWKPYQLLQAIEILGTIPLEEHAAINRLLDGPFTPPEEGLQVLTNLQAHTPAQRQHIYTLHASPDERDHSMAITLAAQKAPEPDPQVILAGTLIKAVEEIRERQRRNWRLPFAAEPWSGTLEEIDALLVAVQERWRGIAQEVRTLHQERIQRHAEAFDPAR